MIKDTRNLPEFERSYFFYQRDFARRAIEKYGLEGYKDLRRRVRAMREPDGVYRIRAYFDSPDHELLPYGPLTISFLLCMAHFLRSRELRNASKKAAANRCLMAAIHAFGAFQGFAACKEDIGNEINFAAKEMVSDMARKAALVRHSENHAIRSDALKFYAENIDSFCSKDSAAEQIAGKIVPAKFRTVRQWITEYHKNLRSAGTT